MSEENVTFLRRLYDEWAHGDFRSGADLLDPSFEWHQQAEAVEPGSHRGQEGVKQLLGGIFDAWDEFRVEPESFRDAGDQVVVVARPRGKSKRAGMEVDQRFAFVWTFRGEKALRVDVYSNTEEALEAVGLQE